MAEMGIGRLGSPDIIIKRKFRWMFMLEVPGAAGTKLVPAHYVKIAGRPHLELDDTELNFLNGVTWLPGKGRWQPLTITYIDTNDEAMKPLYDWIASVYGGFSSTEGVDPGHTTLYQTEKKGWNAKGLLTMLDGCGKTLEEWELSSVFPQSIDFGGLDYTDNEAATIELTIKFSEAQLRGRCGTPTPQGSCVSPCDELNGSSVGLNPNLSPTPTPSLDLISGPDGTPTVFPV